MMSRLFSLAIVILVPLSIALLCLYPLRWSLPSYLANGAKFQQDHTISFEKPGLSIGADVRSWLQKAIDEKYLKVSLHIKPATTQIHGYANILTISVGILPYLEIVQRGHSLNLNLLSNSSYFGIKQLPNVQLEVPDIFHDGESVRLELVVDGSDMALHINEHLVGRSTLPGGLADRWWHAFATSLIVGNNVHQNRAWMGEIYSFGIATRHGNVPVKLTFPKSYWSFNFAPVLIPFHVLNVRDAILNVVLYLPFGLAMFVLFSRRSILVPILAILLFSVSIEILQTTQRWRHPSIDDVIFNLVGGILGLGLSSIAMRSFCRWRTSHHLTTHRHKA